ncbi:MAG: hypothetical protein K9G62_05265 [Alphaproteobacteria bacterium]|nr:hypothetical protein [Alphaproteobacteria bacterium]
MKAKIYRAFALAFAFLGLIVFSMLFNQQMHGNFAEAMKDPFTIVILLFSFAPAAVFSWRAARLEKKLLAARSQQE